MRGESIVKRLWCGAIVLVALSILLPSAANAAPRKTAIAISPPLFELSANPGDSISNSIRVDNITDETLPVTLERKDFVALGEEGQAIPINHRSPYSLASWIQFETASFNLAPRSSKTVNFRIVVPPNAEPGGHFGTVVFNVKLPASHARTGIGIGQEIDDLLLLKVAGTVREKASIVSFKSLKNVWESGPIQFETRFKNSGNVHLKPSGTVTISNMFGQKVGTTTLEPTTVLPDSIRRITSSFNEGMWPGWYTATASLGYGSKNQLLTSTTNFMVFPYKVIIPVVVVLSALGFLVFRARKRLARSLKILFGKE